MERCAKIVATLGPASQDEATMRQMLQAGVNVARLNFSHGSHEDHALVIERLRKIAKELGRPICIMQDLQGPKIRTGELAAGQVTLTPGQTLTLTTKRVAGDEQLVSVDFDDLPRSVEPGGRILLDDGNLELVVTDISATRVETRVVLGGTLKPHKGINLPRAKLTIHSFTQKDEADLAFGLAHGVDAIALSFVRAAADVARLQQAIARIAPHCYGIPIIAKLERPEALDHLDEIMQVADGVMVARGDLGVEMSPEAVPIAQKRIIECANRHAKIVITATQMLDSMMHNPRPTRAEASDVANAIFDGTDAVMLSGETAAGDYPVKAVQMMDAIVRQAEAHAAEFGKWKGTPTAETTQDDTYFMTLAARELAHARNVAAIAVFTRTGRTALLMSKTRPNVPILAFTPDPCICQRMGLYWGVRAHVVPQVETVQAMLVNVEAAMMETTPIRRGQQVVVTCGYPVDAARPTNMALLHTVGEIR